MSDMNSKITVKVISFKKFEEEYKPKRDIKITTRLTRKEYMKLTQESQKYGIRPSVYLRKAVLEKIGIS